MDVTVCCGTYGERSWVEMAHGKACESAVGEGVGWVHRHGETLAEARNAALSEVRTEFVIFCDADDHLQHGYVEQMAKSDADLRAPLVRYVIGGVPGKASYPRVVGHDHLCEPGCLEEGNWIVIGACVRTELLRRVGGFGEEPIWEDWAAWLRCYRAGATIDYTLATYCATVSEGRNADLGPAERRRVYEGIRA